MGEDKPTYSLRVTINSLCESDTVWRHSCWPTLAILSCQNKNNVYVSWRDSVFLSNTLLCKFIRYAYMYLCVYWWACMRLSYDKKYFNFKFEFRQVSTRKITNMCMHVWLSWAPWSKCRYCTISNYVKLSWLWRNFDNVVSVANALNFIEIPIKTATFTKKMNIKNRLEKGGHFVSVTLF